MDMKKTNDDEFLKSKLFLFSLIQFVVLIFLVATTIIVFQDSNSFFAPLDRETSVLTGSVQAKRAWATLFSTIFIIISFLIIHNSRKLENKNRKNITIFTLALVSPVNLFFCFKDLLKDKLFSYWLNLYKAPNENNYVVSFPEFLRILFKKTNISRKTVKINFILYITFSFCFLAFIINTILFNSSDDPYNLYNFYIFAKVTFFTQLTNTLCFLYTIYFLIFKNTLLVKNTNIKIIIASYIVVVATVFVFIIIPGKKIFHIKSNYNILGVISGLNQHILVPIFFVWFIYLLLINEKQKSDHFLKISLRANVYPIWYSMYVYTLSFVCRFSPYFSITNMNPNMILFDSENARGNYWHVLYTIIIIVYLILWYFIFWSINLKSRKENIKDNIKIYD